MLLFNDRDVVMFINVIEYDMQTRWIISTNVRSTIIRREHERDGWMSMLLSFYILNVWPSARPPARSVSFHQTRNEQIQTHVRIANHIIDRSNFCHAALRSRLFINHIIPSHPAQLSQRLSNLRCTSFESRNAWWCSAGSRGCIWYMIANVNIIIITFFFTCGIHY